MECVRAKIIGDEYRYNRIRKIISEHRVNVEAELREVGKGKHPLPHIVLDKLLGESSTFYSVNKRSDSSGGALNETIAAMTRSFNAIKQ